MNELLCNFDRMPQIGIHVIWIAASDEIFQAIPKREKSKAEEKNTSKAAGKAEEKRKKPVHTNKEVIIEKPVKAVAMKRPAANVL